MHQIEQWVMVTLLITTQVFYPIPLEGRKDKIQSMQAEHKRINATLALWRRLYRGKPVQIAHLPLYKHFCVTSVDFEPQKSEQSFILRAINQAFTFNCPWDSHFQRNTLVYHHSYSYATAEKELLEACDATVDVSHALWLRLHDELRASASYASELKASFDLQSLGSAAVQEVFRQTKAIALSLRNGTRSMINSERERRIRCKPWPASEHPTTKTTPTPTEPDYDAQSRTLSCELKNLSCKASNIAHDATEMNITLNDSVSDLKHNYTDPKLEIKTMDAISTLWDNLTSGTDQAYQEFIEAVNFTKQSEKGRSIVDAVQLLIVDLEEDIIERRNALRDRMDRIRGKLPWEKFKEDVLRSSGTEFDAALNSLKTVERMLQRMFRRTDCASGALSYSYTQKRYGHRSSAKRHRSEVQTSPLIKRLVRKIPAVLCPSAQLLQKPNSGRLISAL
ncbi:unnamed protein product [Calicophoron daubneyi]|uniref:Uncharacterized protein n=1 Tax=Calicophoron daubneyi TaxID=300641 RepID=A0AAV2TGZ0_CALDB